MDTIITIPEGVSVSKEGVNLCKAVGNCAYNPTDYGDYTVTNSNYYKPTVVQKIEFAIKRLEQCWEMDQETHAKNVSVIENNEKARIILGEVRKALGIPTSYAEPDPKSRARFPKYIQRETGIMKDINQFFPLYDGFEMAKANYQRLSAHYNTALESAKRTAEVEKRKAEAEIKKEQDKRRADMELAKMLVKYDLGVSCDWDDVLAMLCGKDKFLNLGHAMERCRYDLREYRDQVGYALDSFNPSNETEEEIYSTVSQISENVEDGREYRDCKWSYDVVLNMADADVLEDYYIVTEHLNDD